MAHGLLAGSTKDATRKSRKERIGAISSLPRLSWNWTDAKRATSRTTGTAPRRSTLARRKSLRGPRYGGPSRRRTSTARGYRSAVQSNPAHWCRASRRQLRSQFLVTRERTRELSLVSKSIAQHPPCNPGRRYLADLQLAVWTADWLTGPRLPCNLVFVDHDAKPEHIDYSSSDPNRRYKHQDAENGCRLVEAYAEGGVDEKDDGYRNGQR